MRTVPAALQTHLDAAATTTTRLLRIQLKSGDVYGLCMLNEDITYDDGDGPVTYSAADGFDASAVASDVAFSVANTEGRALLSASTGITPAMVKAGETDDATWKLYLVNWQDLSDGHVLLDAGDCGEITTEHDMVWIPELVSYGLRLRQPVGSVWSRSCRAIFGSPADSQLGCGVNAELLWINGAVTVVGAETNRIFTGDVIMDSNNLEPAPGRVQFLTGANAGREFAVEEVAGNVVTLSETTNYPIAVSDTYRIRPDCAKRYAEDCIAKYANGPNFKGEPLIPVGDAAGVQAPGAQLPRAGGFVARARGTTG